MNFTRGMKHRFRGTDWPRLDLELSNALQDAFLRGIEEGRRRERKELKLTIDKIYDTTSGTIDIIPRQG